MKWQYPYAKEFNLNRVSQITRTDIVPIIGVITMPFAPSYIAYKYIKYVKVKIHEGIKINYGE